MVLLIPAIELHQAKLERTPRLVAADAGFYSAKNEAAAKAMGVKRDCITNRASKSAARKREQKKRWFRNGQRWRTWCEGRISVSKRRHGLNRCRYRGDDGMQRWVGLGVIADNLITVGLGIIPSASLGAAAQRLNPSAQMSERLLRAPKQPFPNSAKLGHEPNARYSPTLLDRRTVATHPPPPLAIAPMNDAPDKRWRSSERPQWRKATWIAVTTRSAPRISSFFKSDAFAHPLRDHHGAADCVTVLQRVA